MGTQRLFQRSVIEITVTAIRTVTTTITTTTPTTMEGVLLEDVQVLVTKSGGNGDVVGVTTDDGVGLEHSSSLREDMATGQLGSTLISIPVTMTLAPPPLTQSSIREMRESLSVSEVPSSLARYVTNDGDSSEQENDCVSMMSSQSGQYVFNCCKIADFISSFLCSVYTACIAHKEITNLLSLKFLNGTYYQFSAEKNSFKPKLEI